jgi:hypothetical protein
VHGTPHRSEREAAPHPRHIRVTFDLSGIGAVNVICDGEASDPYCAWNRTHP